MAFECVSRTDVGLRRKVNEDSILVRTERGLWAVADGMGGHEAGDVASAMVTEALQRLPIVYGLEQLVEAAIDQLRRVNRQLIELAAQWRSPTHDRHDGGRLGHRQRTLPLLLGRRQPRLRVRGGKSAHLRATTAWCRIWSTPGCLLPMKRTAVRTPISSPAQSALRRTSTSTARRVMRLPGDLFLLASDGADAPGRRSRKSSLSLDGEHVGRRRGHVDRHGPGARRSGNACRSLSPKSPSRISSARSNAINETRSLERDSRTIHAASPHQSARV